MRIKVIAVVVSLFAFGVHAEWAMNFDAECAAAVASSANSWSPIPNLLYHWKMNDNAADFVVAESIANMPSTSVVRQTSAMTTAGKVNSALAFNGSSDRLWLTNNSLGSIGTNQFTIAFWINVAADTTANRNDLAVIIGGWDKGALIRLDAGGFRMAVRGNDNVLTALKYTKSQWLHFAATRNSTVVNAYSNGVLAVTVNQASNTNSIDFTAQQYRIGQDSTPLNWYLNGALDDFRIYSRELLQEEITRIAAGTEQE